MKFQEISEDAGLNLTLSETPKTGFLASWPILFAIWATTTEQMAIVINGRESVSLTVMKASLWCWHAYTCTLFLSLVDTDYYPHPQWTFCL